MEKIMTNPRKTSKPVVSMSALCAIICRSGTGPTGVDGEPGTDPKQVALESAPESERWDPVPGSTGHKVPEAPSADEDEEGRSDNERLVEEGIADAEHDQMRQASLKTDS